MKITIDKKQIEIFAEDKNIVDVADREKIGIPAPCYRANRSKGCCNACVVEVNGKKEYACGTKPLDGMDIVVNREDLIELRKEKIKQYEQNISKGCGCDRGCSGSESNCC